MCVTQIDAVLVCVICVNLFQKNIIMDAKVDITKKKKKKLELLLLVRFCLAFPEYMHPDMVFNSRIHVLL